MDYIKDKDLIVIYSKKMGLETLANKLADLNADQVSGFFHNRNIKIPRKMNVLALFGALNDRIKELDSKSLSRDGFTKLQNYANFSEYLLENLFVKVGTEDNFKNYRKYLWMLILRNYKMLNLLDGEVQYLINVRKQKIESSEDFFYRINESKEDMKSEFDGIPESCIEPLLKECYSQDDIRKLAQKYDIVIPNRLKKEELLEYVKQILESKRKLTKTLEKEINGMTVVQLNSFCKLHQIELSANLKKNELIFLFLFLLNQQDIEKMNDADFIGFDWGIPLEFSVDLSAIDTFGRGTAKKVIILKDEPVEEEQPTPTKPDSIIPIRVEGVDVLLDLEHGTVLPDNSNNTKESKPEEKTKLESKEEPVAEPKEEPVAAPEEKPEAEPEEKLEDEPEEELEDEPEEELEDESEEELEDESEEELEDEPEEELEDEPEEELEDEPEEELEDEPEEELEDEPEEELEDEPEEELEDEPEEELEDEPEEELEDEPEEEPEDEPEEEPEDEPEEESEDEPEEESEDEPEEESEDEPEEEPEEKPEEESEDEPGEASELPNESYDEEFQSENSPEPEEMNEPGKESPYFRNKKLLSKKKAVIITCAVISGVIAFVVLGFALLYLLG